MSHDFPDGPDYNPEPIDDDPWDVTEAHPDPPEIRYRVVFTPVGWHVIDTHISRDPVGQFGTGKSEYHFAQMFAQEMNQEAPPASTSGDLSAA